MKMTLENIVMAVVDNEAAMSALSEDVRNAIIGHKKLLEKKTLLVQQSEEELRELHEEKEREIDRLLCRGTWGEKVPLHRRFVLCERDLTPTDYSYGKKHEYCAVDLVRSVFAPYWGYYCTTSEYGDMKKCYKEKLKPLYDAKTTDELLNVIRSNYDFFNADSTLTKQPFRIVVYGTTTDGEFEVVGRSGLKTLQEHQKNLMWEFENEK